MVMFRKKKKNTIALRFTEHKVYRKIDIIIVTKTKGNQKTRQKYLRGYGVLSFNVNKIETKLENEL